MIAKQIIKGLILILNWTHESNMAAADADRVVEAVATILEVLERDLEKLGGNMYCDYCGRPISRGEFEFNNGICDDCRIEEEELRTEEARELWDDEPYIPEAGD